MVVERAGELSRRIKVKVTDNGMASLAWDVAKAIGGRICFKFSVYFLNRVPTPPDLLQRFDSRRIPSLPDK